VRERSGSKRARQLSDTGDEAPAMSGPIDDFVNSLLERRKGAPTGEGDREFFLTEVRVLKEKLNSVELRVEELSRKNTELNSSLGTQKVDQADIFEYLNGELSKKTEEIVRLEESVQMLEEDNSVLVAEYETKILTADDAYEVARENMERKIGDLSASLEELTEFRERKDELERDSAQLKANLEDEKREHASHVSELERRHVQEKDRLKKEMLVKLKETKATLHKMTASQLDSTTKRTIAENEQISSELAWQAAEAEKLIRSNEKLTGEAKALKRELELHVQTEVEFARKVHVYQKTIKTLLAKLNSVDLAKRSEADSLAVAEEELERARALAHSQVETFSGETSRLRASKFHADSELEALREDLERARAVAEQRDGAVDDGVRFLLECLDDARAVLSSQTNSMSELATEGGALEGASGLGGLSAFDASALSAEPSQLADIKAPEQREAVLGGMLSRLQAYQKQLQELSMHREWRAVQRHAIEQRRDGRDAVALPPIGMPASAVAQYGGLLPESEIAPGVPMLMPDPFAFGPGLATVPGRAAGVPRGRESALHSASAVDSRVAGSVRPWGNKSRDLPLNGRGQAAQSRTLASSSAI